MGFNLVGHQLRAFASYPHREKLRERIRLRALRTIVAFGQAAQMGLLIAVGFVLGLCVLSSIGCAARPTPEQSWDQANLKRNDKGCPTAIYVAPNGELQQCL